jgi:hypothetical protein
MSAPNQPGNLSEINPREKALYQSVELLAKAAQVAEKSYLREECRLQILELLEPRTSCEESVRMSLRVHISHMELTDAKGGELHELLKAAREVLV